MTEKLFYANQYLQQFTAVVTGCEKYGDGYAVTLSRTAFFPEGGGQPGDRGIIGSAPVIDTVENSGEILHVCSEKVEVGAEVFCSIDWPRRFLHMQQHTGEHIFSGILNGITGYDNVGFHMGEDCVTVDFNGPVTREELERAERLANEKIWQNVPVECFFPDEKELSEISYRFKKEIEGDIRIVRIPGADICACCGTHLRLTGEVGMVKAVSMQNYKSGVRITLKIGLRALEDYSMINSAVHSAGALLKAPPAEVPNAVSKLQDINFQQKNQITALRRRINSLICESVPEGTVKYCAFLEDADGSEVRTLCDSLCEKVSIAAVFSTGEGGSKYCIGSRTVDVRELGRKLNEALNGRGGGQPAMVQGSVDAARRDIERVWHEII